MSRSIRWASLLLLLAPALARSQDIEVTLKNGAHDLTNEVLRVPVQWPAKSAATGAVAVVVNGATLVGQLLEPSYANESIKATDGHVRKDVVAVVPSVKANETLKVVVRPAAKAEPAGKFGWKDEPGDYAETSWVDSSGKSTPVMRYMCKTY